MLIDRLKDFEQIGPDPILVTIGKLGAQAKPVLPALLRRLVSDKGLLDNGAIDALGKISPDAKAAAPKLVAQFGKWAEYTRANAARAVGGIGPETQSALPGLHMLSLWLPVDRVAVVLHQPLH
jgi:HEAT repeat protein